jgi:hypothetical protein
MNKHIVKQTKHLARANVSFSGVLYPSQSGLIHKHIVKHIGTIINNGLQKHMAKPTTHKCNFSGTLDQEMHSRFQIGVRQDIGCQGATAANFF